MKILENTILNKQIKLQQPQQGYRTSIDPILLAGSCFPKAGEHVLDMGCGVGTLGLCILKFQDDIHLTGIDIQKDYIKLAQENATLNGFESQATYIHQDINAFEQSGFDHIVMNPPYYEDGAHIPSPLKDRATAHGGKLDDWFKSARKLLKKGGFLSVILPIARMEDALKLLKKHQFGAVQIFPLFPKQGKPAKRVIIKARLYKSGQLVFYPGMILHNDDGSYTKEASKILYGQTKFLEFTP